MYNDLIAYAIDVLDKQDYSYQELIGVIKDLFAQIAPKLNIGLITFYTNCRKNVYSEKRINYVNDFYQGEKYNVDKVLEFKNDIRNNGSYIVSLYPVDDFTTEEIECIGRLNFIFSKTLSRAKQSEIISETPTLDPLTGYLNTAGLNSNILSIVNQGKIDKYVTLFINIKDCSSINRLCGSIQDGNILIRQFADRIYSELEEDEIIGRHGGDNFTIMVKKENSAKIIELLKGINVSANIKGRNVSITIESVIGCYNNKKGDDNQTIMENSSIAMQMCKRQKNTNIIVFNEELQNKIDLKRRVKDNFGKAVLDGRIIPYYQPKVDSTTNLLYGAEALSRWQKEDGELISPGLFIPTLEEAGTICDLDFIILEKVCENIKEQVKSGITPVPISINFSKHHFSKRSSGISFVKRIINTIRDYGVDPKLIEVEFTESIKVEDYVLLRHIVSELHNEVIKVSIDDYGTGYSSLQLLESVPFDIIKMDKSFADLIGTQKGNIIFKYTTEMMRKLGKEIICEGVETKEQIDFLNSIKCTIIQGYYFDKPLPKEEYEERLKVKQYKK